MAPVVWKGGTHGHVYRNSWLAKAPLRAVCLQVWTESPAAQAVERWNRSLVQDHPWVSSCVHVS